MRFAVDVVRRVREACGPDFIIIYRLSMLALVEGGADWDEVVAQARTVEAAGATIINNGIGWHEARVPTRSEARRVGKEGGRPCRIRGMTNPSKTKDKELGTLR